ncbi:capsid cement protein [Nocardia otitidiscaviarum]|uniref:capsid cement protein n=1 Tax=Nocardia otitidiscaviarum TaxID=1823 RepID=UPI002457CD27|nr:capsid cement protein [Nocardia otitidiscaviarum]
MSTVIPNPRVYAPGADITALATAVVTARRFVGISGNRAPGGNLSVAHAPAAARAFGVAAHDAALGELVTVARGGIVKVTAAATIAAGAEVEVGANGQAITRTSGVAVGYAVTAATSGTAAEIALL